VIASLFLCNHESVTLVVKWCEGRSRKGKVGCGSEMVRVSSKFDLIHFMGSGGA